MIPYDTLRQSFRAVNLPIETFEEWADRIREWGDKTGMIWAPTDENNLAECYLTTPEQAFSTDALSGLTEEIALTEQRVKEWQEDFFRVSQENSLLQESTKAWAAENTKLLKKIASLKEMVAARDEQIQDLLGA